MQLSLRNFGDVKKEARRFSAQRNGIVFLIGIKGSNKKRN